MTLVMGNILKKRLRPRGKYLVIVGVSYVSFQL